MMVWQENSENGMKVHVITSWEGGTGEVPFIDLTKIIRSHTSQPETAINPL